jgi:hypothetical protein
MRGDRARAAVLNHRPAFLNEQDQHVINLQRSMALMITILLTMGNTLTPTALAADNVPPAPAALYTASDFARLADGVDPGVEGEVEVHVWAPPGDEWRLKYEGGQLALTLPRSVILSQSGRRSAKSIWRKDTH